jgi:hypothetical protein
MSKPSTEKQLKDRLESFGRYLRAGNDNIINYVSMWLASGPRTDELRTIFRDPPDWLVVDTAEDGRIIRIGLSAWLDRTDVETDTTPSSEQELWDLILQQRADMDILAGQVATLTSELSMAHQLMGEDDSTHQCPSITQSQPALCEHGDLPGKLAEVEAQLARVTSSRDSLRAAYDKAIEQRNELRRDIKPLRTDLEKWEKFRDNPNSDPELMQHLAATLIQQRMSVLELQLS